MTTLFHQQLQKGMAGEGAIAQWYGRRGYSVLPVRGRIEEEKGPRVYPPFQCLGIIAPDLLVWKGNEIFWVEVKTKSEAIWYRKGSYWATGVDRYVWEHYLEINRKTPWPVVLLFLHSPSGTSPSGLFGGDVAALEACIDGKTQNFGRTGGVFWKIDQLTKYAEYSDVLEVHDEN